MRVGVSVAESRERKREKGRCDFFTLPSCHITHPSALDLISSDLHKELSFREGTSVPWNVGRRMSVLLYCSLNILGQLLTSNFVGLSRTDKLPKVMTKLTHKIISFCSWSALACSKQASQRFLFPTIHLFSVQQTNFWHRMSFCINNLTWFIASA